MIGNHFSKNLQIQDVNDAVVTIDDINFSYGFGVYETLKLRKGVLFFPEDHTKRLHHSAKIIDLPHAWQTQDIVQGLDELVESNDVTDANIKAIMVGSNGSPDLYMFMINPLFPDRKSYRDGVKVISYEGQRQLPQAKSLNMLISSMAYRKARENGAYDALLVDGLVFEGTRTNVFFTDGEKVFTPPKETVLDGVTRKYVMQIAVESGIEVVETPIPSDTIDQYVGGFLTSTSSKVMPIQEIDDIKFIIPDVVRELQRNYNMFLESYENERRR